MIKDNLKVATWNVREIANKDEELVIIFEKNTTINIDVVMEKKEK